MAVDGEIEALPVVAAEGEVARPGAGCAQERTAARGTVVDGRWLKEEVGGVVPVALQRGEMLEHETALDRVAIEVAVVPHSDPDRTLPEALGSLVIDVLHHRV